ncbi:MAG: nucleotide sugar dehydrogenase [Bacteroidetes bacterium]|jgi:UDP-N-acetyl-D-glucosamine/UDP-N-acetyl-D-galactosamine dehydrogenase|nr:nucleotide sugar dehydrogenase [Bacteroidota bacterium]
MYQKLTSGKATISVVGLGYVGLPIALAFAKKVRVIGFDINEERINMMKEGVDPSGEIEPEEFEGCDITFTAKSEDLKNADFHIVAVPTPINPSHQPDLKPLISASTTLGAILKKGDYVVYESTVYPGCTEEDCIPVLEKVSGLKFGVDFKVGYSPERINPGDKVHTLDTIVKVVGAGDEESTEQVARVYELVVSAGIHQVSCIKVAEASKIIENTQRDLNIALVNELSIIFNKVGINTYEVLEAAGTKWNFLPFKPGLVGGHCIGIDPYYLTWKSSKMGYHAKVINSARYINDSMGFYVGKQTVKKILARGVNALGARVLVMGLTFKENVEDIRNTKVIDVISELESFNVKVDVVDPMAQPDEVLREYGIELCKKPEKGVYHAVIVAVNHDEYAHLTEEDLSLFMEGGNGVLVDLKGIYRNRIKNLDYWSL